MSNYQQEDQVQSSRFRNLNDRLKKTNSKYILYLNLIGNNKNNNRRIQISFDHSGQEIMGEANAGTASGHSTTQVSA